ncbi:MAG: hypothetical protein AB1758_00770, partial [Candidatus Eremiobacterota bacterium]
PQPDGVEVPVVLGKLCAAVAECLGGDPRDVWATWETVSHYVVGGDAAEIQPRSTHSPVVRLLALEGRPAELREAMMVAVDRVLTRELSLEPGNVFVEYAEVRRGFVLDGGRVVG